VLALQGRLRSNTALLDDLLTSRSIIAGTASPIRGVLMDDEFAAINATKTLHEHGYAVTAAMYPTVELGRPINRVATSASPSANDIRSLAPLINTIVDG
jgi:7-keto-8-aminopelargonate synthetase-like enzyme